MYSFIPSPPPQDSLQYSTTLNCELKNECHLLIISNATIFLKLIWFIASFITHEKSTIATISALEHWLYLHVE